MTFQDEATAGPGHPSREPGDTSLTRAPAPLDPGDAPLTSEPLSLGPRRPSLGVGQLALPPATPDLVPAEHAQTLFGLSDPALSELGLEDFLDELLVRVQDALSVDTVAILLLDRETDQLVARAAKGIEEEVEQGVRIPIGRGFAGRIAAERVAIFISDVDHADILNPILRRKGIRSLLGVPLIVEGDLIGVMHVGSLKPRTFGMRDVAVLQVAAARAAPGIERARLSSALQEEHRVAIALQRSLLPKPLVEVPGVLTATRYLPASYEVGGDWYDVFELPGGRIGAAIGDVVGHGLKAAALMGQLRTALHAYALEGHSPARTLEQLDRYVQSMPDYAMATAAYAVFDPESGGLVIANLGHLPPVIVGHGAARVLDLPAGSPLGAFPYGRLDEHDTRLEPGEMLVFYTDGLIERPRIPLTTSIETLVETVRSGQSPEQVCRLATDNLIPVDGLRDDVALVALQNCEVPAELEFGVAASPKALAQVRRSMRRWLRHRGASDEETAEVTLAVSEACANAIEHAYSPAPARFHVRAYESDGEVAIVVRDQGQWRSPRGRDRGRGLTIMRAATDSCEVHSGDAGTEVVLRRRLRR